MALALGAIGLFVWAAMDDVARRRIPNRIVICLALLGGVRIVADAVQAGPVGPAADVALAAAVFAAGAGLFWVGAFGGGDVKLMAAGTLWSGAGAFWPFLAWTAIAGGALALAFLIMVARRRGDTTPVRPSLPYGVAIAAGGVAATLSTLVVA